MFSFLRFLHVIKIILRHKLDVALFSTARNFWLRLLFKPWLSIRHSNQEFAVCLRETLQDLGPIYVKFGQILSTRRDMLPENLIDELSLLQDQVPPFPSDQSVAVIESSLDCSISDAFAEFETTPFASASIAQVHAATTHQGEQVVVKVRRPGIKKHIKKDLALLFSLAWLVEKIWKDGRRLKLTEVVGEFEKTILDELDFIREAANASQLKRNFDGSEDLYVPGIHWEFCRHNLLVIERVFGMQVDNIAALEIAGVDLEKLSEAGVRIFFTQVFRDNFFHADMHPGNIFVSPEGQFQAVDFGIVGVLNYDDQEYLAGNFLAFFNRDYRKVAELHLQSGWVPRSTNIAELESAIRTVCEPIFDRPLKDISFGNLLIRLFQTAARFDMEIQPQLVLLQKTLLNIEGLGRQLNPDLDLWKTAKPFLEEWMKTRYGGKGMLKRIYNNLPQISNKIPDLPLAIMDYYSQNQQQQLAEKEEHSQALLAAAGQTTHKVAMAIMGATAWVSATLLLPVSLQSGYYSMHMAALVSLLAGGAVCFALALRRVK